MRITPNTRPVKRLIFSMVRLSMNRNPGWSRLKLIHVAELFNAVNQIRQPYVRFKDRFGD